MKTRNILASMLLLAAGLQCAWAQSQSPTAPGKATVVVKLMGGEPVRYDVSQVEFIAFEEGEPPIVDGHEYVEIGGLKWATMNVGATTVAGNYATCFGDYFAWSETQPRYALMTRTSADDARFTWKAAYSNGHKYNKYPDYTDPMLDAAHDAATAIWGSKWRTPTREEFVALARACSWSENEQMPKSLNGAVTAGGIYWLDETQTCEPAYTGVAGLLFVCADDITKQVFFPACGGIHGTSLYYGGTAGYYCSSSFNTSSSYDIYGLIFTPSRVIPSDNDSRFIGFSVRPVAD